MSRNYYEVLGLTKESTKSDIKKSYRKLAMRFHPDKNPNDKEAEKNFKEVAEAYEVLGNDTNKKRYDSIGHNAYTNGGSRGGHSSGFGSMEDAFREMRRTQTMAMEKNKHSFGHTIKLTMEEVYLGVNKNVVFNRKIKCKTCDGKGGEKTSMCTQCNGDGVHSRVMNTPQGRIQQIFTCHVCNGSGFKILKNCGVCHGDGLIDEKIDKVVDIPISVLPNQKLVLSNLGHYYDENGLDRFGDVYVMLVIEQDKFKFKTEVDLLSNVEVDYPTIILGGKFEFTTIDGVKVMVPVSKFTPIGRRLKLRGKGLKNIGNEFVRGDQYIEVGLKLPTELSQKEEELLKELKKNSK